MTRIYHTSDLHDNRGFVPRMQALRAERPGLYFDCGDSLRGSQTVYHRAEPIIGELDAAGCDAQSIGNREFHYLFPLLRARAARMAHPLVCTNLLDTKGRELPFVPSLTFEREGVRVHVLGLLIMQYPTGSPWERVFGWRFLDPWDAIEPYARDVPAGDMLVVLSHVGLSLDRKLAQRVPRIDLCSADTATIRSSNRSTSAACRSCTRGRTGATRRAPNWTTTAGPRASRYATSRSFR
jgi:2',3'-cyclic-nucleotide 2'-phosphodiesterase (5'-nucleotidase family)